METEAKSFFTLLIPGRPSGKDRPRFIRATGRVFSPDVNNFQAKVATAAQAAGVTLYEGVVEVTVEVERRFPTSYSKKKRANLVGLYAPGRPDGCNIEAAVWDALQGIAYHDDSQIGSSAFSRTWGDRDATTIRIEGLPA